MSEQSTTACSRRPRVWRRRVLRCAGVCVVLGGLWQAFWWHHLKRFQAVRPGQVYRVAQPTEFGFWYMARRYGVRTVVSLRLEDAPIGRGMVDFSRPDGMRESECLSGLGLRLVNWPMGDEACWPWLSPWQFEECFKFFDEPANLPAALHCVGGRHRTGTMLALYRMEYDRWPADRAIREMHSFSFGPPVPYHDLNLRTYYPRPRPDETARRRLQTHFAAAAPDSPPDYESWVRSLRGCGDRPLVARLTESYLRSEGPFALPLAARLIDEPDDPLAELAAERAPECLLHGDRSRDDWAAAAALVADFGDAEQQLRLLDLLSAEDYDTPPSPRYQAVVAGVTNRYTPNRIAFLRPLLHDKRPVPDQGASGYRHCDLAVARLSAILDKNLLRPTWDWEAGRRQALAWFDTAPEIAQLSPLLPPTGRKHVSAVATPADADRTFQR